MARTKQKKIRYRDKHGTWIAIPYNDALARLSRELLVSVLSNNLIQHEESQRMWIERGISVQDVFDVAQGLLAGVGKPGPAHNTVYAAIRPIAESGPVPPCQEALKAPRSVNTSFVAQVLRDVRKRNRELRLSRAVTVRPGKLRMA